MSQDRDRSREELFRRFTGMRAGVLGYLRVLVRDAHLAEDLFQETCLVVLRKLETFDPAGDLGAWARAIALNLARNALRKERYVHLMTSPGLAEAIDRAYVDGAPDEEGERSARLEHLAHCMGQVEVRQRRLLDLRYRAGESLERIARETGRSSGAVQVALSRLRQFLLKCIERQKSLMSHGYGPA